MVLKEYKHKIPMTNDTIWNGCVPPGYLLEKIVFVNLTTNDATLNLGTSAFGKDVFEQELVGSNVTTIVINKVFSMNERTTLYISGTWNLSSLKAILLMRRVLL